MGDVLTEAISRPVSRHVALDRMRLPPAPSLFRRRSGRDRSKSAMRSPEIFCSLMSRSSSGASMAAGMRSRLVVSLTQAGRQGREDARPRNAVSPSGFKDEGFYFWYHPPSSLFHAPWLNAILGSPDVNLGLINQSVRG